MIILYILEKTVQVIAGWNCILFWFPRRNIFCAILTPSTPCIAQPDKKFEFKVVLREHLVIYLEEYKSIDNVPGDHLSKAIT